MPSESLATAVSVCEPLLAVVVSQGTEYGAVVSSAPRLLPSSLNCTPATVRAPTLSSAPFLKRTRCLLNAPFLLTTPFSLPARVLEPPVGRRFVRKAPHIQAVLSRDQLDVVVRKPQVPGVTQQRDAPRRCD